MDVRRAAGDTQLIPQEINGRTYYTAVIDRFYLRFPEKGKHRISGGQYKLATSRPQEYYHPFWGRSVENVMEVTDLAAPALDVKVNPLPEKGRPANFSGAVGDFEITAEFPEGGIEKGEDAILAISISGIGSLDGALLPDIRSMLPEGMQFKSMTDAVSHFVKDGELGSEVVIECVVTPKREGEFVVDGVSFSYYDILTGKYKTITAAPLTIEAGNGLPSSGQPPVIMEI